VKAKDLDKINPTNKNSSYEEWYKILTEYTNSLDGWSEDDLKSIGEERLKIIYNSGCGIKRALIEGFE